MTPLTVVAQGGGMEQEAVGNRDETRRFGPFGQSPAAASVRGGEIADPVFGRRADRLTRGAADAATGGSWAGFSPVKRPIRSQYAAR